jgi:hypothetical protein
LLIFLREAGGAEKALQLVTIAGGGSEAVEIAFFALNLPYQLSLVLPERIYSQSFGYGS